MEYKFLNTNRKLYINNVIQKKILVNLLKDEFDILMKYLHILIEYISIRFAIKITDYDSFWHQLTQNNNRDIIALFNLLLPYIDDKEGNFDLHKQIYKLEDISIKKDPLLEKINDESINKYLISNIQYNMYHSTETKLSINNIEKNFSLLLETIDRVSNKLYVNWLNIIPLTLKNYTESNLFKSSIKLSYDSSESTIIENLSINLKLIPTPNLRLLNTYFILNDIDQQTKIDANTLSNISEVDLIYDNLIKNKGISMGDIFNTIHNDLFFDILKIKWLIYQSTFNNVDIDEIYIKIFNVDIAIAGLYQNIKWNELTIDQQLLFISKWNIFKNKVNITNSDIKKGYFNLLYNIIIFMERNYNKINSIIGIHKYQRISVETDFDVIDNDDSFNDDKSIIDITPHELITRIKVLPIEDIYTYLCESIQKFMKTWYGKNIILNINNTKKGVKINGIDEYKFNYDSYFKQSIKKDDLHKYNINIDLPEDLTIKYKFIYNFAKAFVLVYDTNYRHKRNDPYTRPLWYNMSQNERIRMVKFLNQSYYQAIIANRNESEVIDRLNIMSFANYYKRVYSNSTTKYNNKHLFEIDKIKNQVESVINLGIYIGNQFYQHIRDDIINITFECHIMKGLLSELRFNKNLTDKLMLGTSDEFKKNQFNNITKYILTPKAIEQYSDYAYYYLTDKTYGELNEIHQHSKKNYFELISSEYRWNSSYAMDWVSQINFFHHYINNRVIYVTGATGQGKSTQVPKLFLYSLKMIDKKSNGRVICSQPRINATKINSKRISWELGVPIVEKSINYKKEIPTYNPYIQYQTQIESHLVEYNSGLLLKLVTDKLLSMELLKSPIFKLIEKSIDDNTTSESIEFNTYLKENIYDVIIVDESHEHNVNMDIILSIARDTIKFNNSLKLVIVSATMIDDEYIYRRYYKEINDNFSYPFNHFNVELDRSRINVDRRIDISPPSETTQHIIKDIYLDHDPLDYQTAEKLAIDKAFDIILNTNCGDILLFSLSTLDIRRICIDINKKLPLSSNVICLPYYRELPNRWDIFDNLSDKVKLITIHREDIFNDISQSSTNIPRKVRAGTYCRVIIVSTNIAEASITIDSLKYVIDTGYNIVISNDPQTMETIIENKLISETSRIQRRGRVGRTSSGTVYYMYMKDSRKNIKSNYKICIENIYSELYDLSPRIYNDIPLISNFNYVNHIFLKFDRNQVRKLIYSESKQIIDSKIFLNLIIYQYTNQGYILPSILNLISKKTHSGVLTKNFLMNKLKLNYNFNREETFNLISNRGIRYISGYDIKNDIYDINGEFYIIHPDEINIKRNLLTGNIIKIKKFNSDEYINTNQIISVKIYNYFKRCFYYNLFINTQIKYIDEDIFIMNDIEKFSTNYFQYDKSIIGRIIQTINNQIKLTDEETVNRSLMMTIIYSYVCKLDHIVILMIALLINSNFSINNLNPNIDIFKILYSNDDIYIYYSLALKIYQKHRLFEFTNFEEQKIIFNSMKDSYIKQKHKIVSDLKNKSNYWEINIPLDTYTMFNLLDNQNKLNSEKNIFNYVNEIAKNINPEIKTAFAQLLKSIVIDVDNAKSTKILKSYIEIKNIIDKLKNTQNIPHNNNDLLWFDYYLPIRKESDEFTNIKKAFIFGFGLFQTIIYDDDSGLYININNLSKKLKISPNTLSVRNEMAVYLYNNRLSNEVSIIINSDLDTLVECNLYNYNPLFINNIKNSTIINRSVFNKLLQKFISIHKNKYKYINYLNNDTYHDPNLKKLLSYPNNFTEYLIKLWTTDVDLDKQYGGKISHNLIKINIDKIPKLLNKSNTTYKEFLKIIDDKYYIIDRYLYITI